MTKVSVIIPVYNVEKHLERCLDSVVYQTLKDIEIICVNDCSPDNSLKILNEYAQKDDRIKIINFEENKGVSVARNVGINEAQGEYIGFVDSDDYVDLDFYEKLYNEAKKKNADIIKGNLKYLKNDEELSIFKNLNNKIKKNKYYFNCLFYSAIYRTSLIINNNIKFPEDISYGEDRIFQIKALIKSNEIIIIDNVYYYYIWQELSLTNNNNINQQIKDTLKATIYLTELLNLSYIHNENYEMLFNEFFIQFIELLNKNKNCIEDVIKNIKILNNIVLKNKLNEYFYDIADDNVENVYKNLLIYKNRVLLNKIRNKKLK